MYTINNLHVRKNRNNFPTDQAGSEKQLGKAKQFTCSIEGSGGDTIKYPYSIFQAPKGRLVFEDWSSIFLFGKKSTSIKISPTFHI